MRNISKNAGHRGTYLVAKYATNFFSRKSEAPQHTSLTLRTTSGFNAAESGGIPDLRYSTVALGQ
jgi:hypothetical protein